MTTDKLKILVKEININLYEGLDGFDLDQAVVYLINLRASYKQELNMGYDVRFNNVYEYNDNSLVLEFFREETDNEYKNRMNVLAFKDRQRKKAEEEKLEEARKLVFRNKQAELEEYERLKKKFGE